jgi:DNA polymerase-3 subunit gamma/tau
MYMDKFIVSARKYRPQNFNTVIGQSHITTTLKNAINHNQLAHAFLFCGPRGVGKTTCARILAKTINCENRTEDGEACNSCNSCTSFDNGISLNIHELDAASNNSVDDIRSLTEQVRFAPQAGKYKVYIVDEVHMLSSSAFNAFLKTLEEPPSYAIFILATTEKHKILPTILSRCQIFDFKRITTNDTVEHLEEIAMKEHITAEKAALHIIAQKSEGCMRDALSMLDKIVSFTNGTLTYTNTLEHLNILDEDYYFQLLGLMQNQQLADAMLLYDEINQKGFEGDTLLEGFSEFLRNLLVSKDPKSVVLLEVADTFRTKYLEFAGTLDTGWVIAALNLLNEAVIQYKQAKNKKLHVELLLIKLTYLHQAIQLSIDENGLQKKKIAEKASPVAFRAIPSMKAMVWKEPAHQQTVLQPARLEIETEPEKAYQHTPVIPIIETLSPEKLDSKKSTLSKIREQMNEKKQNQAGVKPLSLANLQDAWQAYIEQLIDRKNPSAVTNFKGVGLSLLDEHCFLISAETHMQQKFIEAERANLVAHLQKFFNNKLIKYQFAAVTESNADTPKEKTRNSREQFQLISEKFPLVKELKERLKLNLDF